MKKVRERDFTTYPRQFKTYRWFKPILVGILFGVFFLLFASFVYLMTAMVFKTTISTTGYDNLDFYSPAGAFYNFAMEAVYIPAFMLAALIVKDRPFSSYLSSMGGWRWKTFLKTLAAGSVILGIPTIISFLIGGRISDVQFTYGGLAMLILLLPLQCLAEELLYRSYIIQTISSWFRIPALGLIAQIIAFVAIHPYNLIGKINIAVSALIYGLITIYSRGIESSCALHISNNLIQLILTGLGFGVLSADLSISSALFNSFLKLLFLVFIIYADKKLHWFDKVQCDDIEPYNAKHS